MTHAYDLLLIRDIPLPCAFHTLVWTARSIIGGRMDVIMEAKNLTYECQ